MFLMYVSYVSLTGGELALCPYFFQTQDLLKEYKLIHCHRSIVTLGLNVEFTNSISPSPGTVGIE